MIGLFISLMVQAVVISVQLTIIAIRLMVTAAIWLARAVGEAMEARPRRGMNGAIGRRRLLPANLRWSIFRRDGHACLHCGSTIDLTIDHIHPVSLGGGDHPSNLQTLCRSCNCRKGAKVLV